MAENEMVKMEALGTEISVPQELVELRAQISHRPKWLRFADLISLDQHNTRQAYLKAYGNYSPANAAKLRAQPQVASIIELQQQALQHAVVLSELEKRSILTRAARADIEDVINMETGEINPGYGDIIQDVTINYNEITGQKTVKVKLIPKLDAIKLDNEISGSKSNKGEAKNLLAVIINNTSDIDSEKEVSVDGEVIEEIS